MHIPSALLVLACAWPLAVLSAPAGLPGVVTQVIDGDSVRFTPQGQAAINVRLRDIDAPELCQPWGPEARAALSALALNKAATLQAGGRDAQGYTLGVLTVDGTNVARRLVEDGHAWSLRGRNDHGPLVKQERMARSLGRGLHGAPGALMPKEFRRQHGPCATAAK